MFDIGWSELLVIAVVLVVVVGPKDLPGMLRTFGRTTKQLRAMAGDFRRQFDDALKEAELDDVRSTVDEMRKLDPRKDIRAAMNPMKAIGDEIRSSLKAAAPSGAAGGAGCRRQRGRSSNRRTRCRAKRKPPIAPVPEAPSSSSPADHQPPMEAPVTNLAATSNFPNGKMPSAVAPTPGSSHSNWATGPGSPPQAEGAGKREDSEGVA